jgi:hypothetical protein
MNIVARKSFLVLPETGFLGKMFAELNKQEIFLTM